MRSEDSSTGTTTVDMVDATFKINTFLNKHLCLFTQWLTYKNKNIKVCAEIFPSNPDGGNKHDDSEKRIDS